MEDTAWKTIPWAKQGLDAKTPTDRLHDILCDFPGILEDYDRVIAWDPMIPGRAQFTAEFLAKILSTMDALYSWRWRWQEEFPDATYLTVPTDADSASSMQRPPSPFQTVIWFRDPLRATELSFYDSLLIIVQSLCELFDIGMEISPFASDPLLPMQGSRMDTVLEICRMADYQLHGLRRSFGAFMLLFPLNVAYRNLEPNSAEALWLEKIMALIADSHGFEMSRRENMPRP